MELDKTLIKDLIAVLDSTSLKFTLNFADKSFPLTDASITEITVPVTKRTQRGGSYFTDDKIFRLKAHIKDKQIISLLPKVMLGPNTEFADIIITTNACIRDTSCMILLYTNLTSVMEDTLFIELNLDIIGTEVH